MQRISVKTFKMADKKPFIAQQQQNTENKTENRKPKKDIR